MAEGGGRRKMANKKQDAPKMTSSSTDLGLKDKKQTKKSKGQQESKLEKLKKAVIRILKKHPEGVFKKDIWSLVLKETGLEVSAKEYGLSKMSRAFEKWSDVIRLSGSPQAERLVLKDEQDSQEKTSELDDFPALEKDNFEPKADLTANVFTVKPKIVREAEETQNSPIVMNRLLPTISSYRKANSGSLETGTFQTTGLRQTEINQIDCGDHVDEHDFEVQSNSNEEVEQRLEDVEELEDEEIHAVIDKLLEERKINEEQKAQPQRPIQSWMHIAEHSTLNIPSQILPVSDTEQSLERREHSLVPDQSRNSTPLVEQPQIPADFRQDLTQAPDRAGQPTVSVQPAIHPGMPAPSLNNFGFPAQGLNRFFIPPQGMNPLGMFLPNLNHPGMGYMGMPFSYGMPVPGSNPFGITPPAQHIRHPPGLMNLDNNSKADTKNEVPDMNRRFVPPSAEITDDVSSVVSTSDSFDPSETKASSPNNMSDSDSSQKRKLSLDIGANEIPTSEADNCGKSTINETQFSKQVPQSNERLINTVPPHVTSDIIKPLPVWTQTGIQDPKMTRIQMPLIPASNIIKPAPAWNQTGFQDPKMTQVQIPLTISRPVTNSNQNQSEVRMPMPPLNQAVQGPYFLEQSQQPGFRHFENLTQSPLLSQIRHQDSAINQTQLSSISKHVEMQNPETRAQRKGIPSWTQIGMQTSDINQVKTPSLFRMSDLNIGRTVAPSMLESQLKMSTRVPEKDSSHSQSIDWSQYDTPKLQQILNNQEKHLQNQKVADTYRQPVISALGRSDLDNWQPFAEDIKCLSVKPISKDEFETTALDIRPVYVPLGKNPTKEQIDHVAKECIELLADANDFVSQERVEKIVLKRFGCNRIQDLGVNYVDQIPCVNELNRLLSKINAYIIAFLKTRSICTLYELKEALREFTPGKGDFSLLKTGPLQRFPVVFQQFRFPPDLAEIPEITTMDILDHFNNFLTQNRLWVNSKLELEAFMKYLVQEYSADNAYMLGVRIRSLPLAITVLKKAKRDSASSHTAIKDHFEENLKTEIGDAFRKFRANILYTGDREGMEVRKHYLKMKPELVIREIFDKFSILLLVTQDRRLTKPTKFRRVIEDFLTVIEEDELGRNILHLAICMSSTAVEETVREMFATPTDADSKDEQEKHLSHKPPPRKDALIESLKTYIERCLNIGAISLTYLDRIEEKMLEDFGYADFSMIGYGRFLEFLLREAKHILEESGGLLLGSASGGTESDSSFKPQQTDLVEFIRQCMQQENIKPEQIEEILCTHYIVKDVRQLGHGNISRLLSHAEKHGRHMIESYTVFYEPALLPASRFSQSSNSKVGILGHQTKEAAKTCLHNCPLLENMADWSHWGLVFEPELGKLKDFVQKYGGFTTKTLEGKVVSFDFFALEIKPGELLKIVSATSQEDVTKAIDSRDIQSTTGHLVSMAVAYKGVENMPLALISRHVTTALIQMHATEPSRETTEFPLVRHAAALFVLQCLLRIPTKICVTLANQIFLEPLGQVIGSSYSKQLLVQLCKTENELNHLIELGCLLGIQEWTDVMLRNCQPQDSAIQILPSEVQELFEEDEQIQEVEDLEEDSDSENIDEILGDDVGNASEREVLDECITSEDSEKDEIISQDTNDKDMEDVMEDGHDQEQTAITSAKTDSPSCEDIVNEIRRDEFGVGVHLSEDGIRLMKVQQERLGRSLDRLSKDLYSKDTHFVLELVQNADDNSYDDSLLDNKTDECPSVKFVIEHDGIYVYNNELGFREKDIKALCDVGRSTKGKHKFGYIGQKGIGFKSVFRITDTPEVHSNGYHIKFDVNSGPMGYIMPHWIPELERISQNGWMTQIILGLKPDMRLHTRTLAARFNDIHPSLLLFLHRLREITIENKVENGVQTMRRRDIGENVVEIQHTHGCDRWLVIKKTLDASKISLQTKSGADVESTELALAFPLKQQGKKTIVNRMPPKQPVFAFLPLRSYGFRFIVQGDFDVPSSREDVDRDSPWNQWLRNEIHTVFIESLDTFKAHPDFSSMEAVCAFLQFVPMEDEVLEFFKPVALDILKKMKAKECVPTQPDSEGVIRWKMPSQTVRIRDPLVRSVITPDLLQSHLSLFYLHNDVACMLNSSLTSCLGIETLTSEHLFQLGKALILKMGTHCSNVEDVILISKWLACLYRSLDEFHQDDAILEMLKTHRMLPLSDGELVSLKDKAVFYPIQSSSNDRKQGKDPLYYLQKDVKSLHQMLLNTDDDEVNSQVHKLFLRLGVKQLSPFELINQHIIPVLKTDAWKTKTQETLISYVIYIKEQVEKQASVCNLEEVKEVVVLMTNNGFQNPSAEPVHFPPQYGNQIRLQEVFSGYKWTILDTCYLPQPCTQHVILTWQGFFRKLGIEDFLSFKKRDEHISRNELEESLWSRQCASWPKDEQEFIVQDYYSAELEGLVTKNHSSGESFASQMSHLFAYLDKYWDSRFSKFCKCQVLGKDGKALLETESSFSIILRTSSWIPAVVTTTQYSSGSVKRDVNIVLKQPSDDVYIKSDMVQGLLFDKVPYLNAKSSGGSFCQFLGIRHSVEIQTLKELLLKWSKRTDDNIPAEFCTTLEHMKHVYQYLGAWLTRRDFQSLLQEEPVFFVPDRKAVNILTATDFVVVGKMLNKKELWLVDKSGLFDRHRQLLEEFHSEISNKRTIAEFYSDSADIIDFFKQEGKLDSQPKVDEYITLLCLLCSTSSPKDGNILADVLCIFSTIGEALASSEGLPGGVSANTAAEALKTFVKRKLKRQQVFPTNKLIWVSLEDKPMIPDNREWEKMFSDKEGVHFLNMDDKSARTSRAKGGNMLRGQRNKAFESRVKPEMINLVIEACGIKKLSEVIDVRPTPDMVSPCLQLQDYFSQITPALQQYLVAKFEDVYQSLEQMNMKDIIANARFYQAGKLEVSYWIPNMSVDTFVIQQEKCVINPPEFYFHKDHLASLGDIASKEVARFFSRGNTDCHNLLRSFLSELFNIVSGVSDESVDGLLQRHEADDVDIPDEDKWKVEAPVLPEPDKPKEKEPENNDTDTEPVTETTNQKEGPFEIRAWPPVANPEKPHSRSTSEMPTSNVWPPPAAKDYMRSVKDLPANIKLVEAGDDSKQSIPCEQNNESDTKKMDVLTEPVVKPEQDVNGPYVHSIPHIDNTIQSEMKSENLTKTSRSGDQTREIKKTENFETENIEVQQAHQIPQTVSTSKGKHNEIQMPDNISVDDARSVNDVQNNLVDDKARSPEKRKDKYRHYGTQWEEDDSPYRERKSVITGEPFWSDLATDYEYEDLGSGKDLVTVEGIALRKGADGLEIGHWGEALCSQYLQRQKELGNIKDYIWKNRDEEAGCPFDFEVKVADKKGSQTIFVEVKSTASEGKEAFEISLQQVKFANSLKDNFHIYRVFNAGNPERVKLIRIKNLQKWLSTKQVKLCIVI